MQTSNIQLTKKEVDKLVYSLIVTIQNKNNVICLDKLTSKQKYYCNTELELLEKLKKLYQI